MTQVQRHHLDKGQPAMNVNLVPTRVAAIAVEVTEQQLERWAATGLVHPAGVDQRGRRM